MNSLSNWRSGTREAIHAADPLAPTLHPLVAAERRAADAVERERLAQLLAR